MERKSKTSNALTNKLHRNIGLDFTMSGSFMLYGVMVLLLLLLDYISVQIQFFMSLCFLLEPFLFSPFILTFPFSLTRMETNENGNLFYVRNNTRKHCRLLNRRFFSLLNYG